MKNGKNYKIATTFRVMQKTHTVVSFMLDSLTFLHNSLLKIWRKQKWILKPEWTAESGKSNLKTVMPRKSIQS